MANLDFALSRHAIQRTLDMGVDGEEIREAFYNPRWSGAVGPNREERTRGRVTLMIALDVEPPMVTTVLWSRASDWVRDLESSAPSRDGWSDHGMAGVRAARKVRKRGRGR